MSLSEIQHKRQVIESRSRIREFVFGIQDGLISTVGLLAGVQGATENSLVVIVTGLTAMFSGAISMAAGEPYIAAEGLLKALGEEGLTKELSYRMVKTLLQERNVFLRTFREKVFGLGSADINQPLPAALVMGLSFIVGAMVPIVPYLILSGVSAFYLSALLGGLTLFGVGAFKGRLAGQSLWTAGMQFFLVAVGAAGLGYLIGLIVQYFFPGITIPAS